MVVESELLGAAAEVLERLGFSNFIISLNHRALLSGMLDLASVPPSQHGEALVALDKIDKIGPEGVASELRSRGVAAPAGTMLLELFSAIEQARATADQDPRAFNRQVLAKLRTLVNGHDNGLRAVRELDEVVTLCEAGMAGARIRVDPSLARGLSYYTGSIFEIAVPDFAASLAGGGRYDELIGMFLGTSVPACGISLGFERILVVMAERGLFPPSLVGTPADVMVTIWNAEKTADAIRLAGELRADGLRVDVYPEPDKIGKQFKYADSRGIPFVTVVGDDEAARGEVAVKNLSSGEQSVMPRAQAAAFIKHGRATR
jgi:histidyl-tRNA synthetase